MQQNRPTAEDQAERAADVPPTPDQDGPHDVPDSQVIDKTLPSRPVGEGDKASS